MGYSTHKVGPSQSRDHLHSPNPPKSWKTYGFAIAIIIGIGALAVGGIGAAGYFGAISNLNQIQALIMMASAGGGGIILFIVGVVGIVRNCKTGSDSRTHSSLHNRGVKINGGRQTEFIERTGAGTGLIRGTQRFGKSEWETYFGNVGNEPDLPDNIDAILNSPCPFSGDESVKVKDTHMLVLVPKTVNEEALTLNNLKKLVKKFGIYSNYTPTVENEHVNTQVERSHWVLMTRDVIPGSTNASYEKQKELVNQHDGYSIPGALPTAVCILMELVLSRFELFKIETRCKEIVDNQYPVTIGNPFLTRNRRFIISAHTVFSDDRYGMAAQRNFET